MAIFDIAVNFYIVLYVWYFNQINIFIKWVKLLDAFN